MGILTTNWVSRLSLTTCWVSRSGFFFKYIGMSKMRHCEGYPGYYLVPISLMEKGGKSTN